MTTFVIADDHPMIRDGVRRLLTSRSGWSVVGEAEDGAEALDLLARERPDIVVLDLLLPIVPGLEVLRQASVRSPDTVATVLSMHVELAYAAESFARGARAYVTKQAVASRLIEAITTVEAGECYVSSPLALDDVIGAAERIAQDRVDPLHGLTPREREVFFHTAAGRSLQDTARRLCISPRTVEVHRGRLYDKLGLMSQADAITFAHDRGLVGRDT